MQTLLEYAQRNDIARSCKLVAGNLSAFLENHPVYVLEDHDQIDRLAAGYYLRIIPIGNSFHLYGVEVGETGEVLVHENVDPRNWDKHADTVFKDQLHKLNRQSKVIFRTARSQGGGYDLNEDLMCQYTQHGQVGMEYRSEKEAKTRPEKPLEVVSNPHRPIKYVVVLDCDDTIVNTSVVVNAYWQGMNINPSLNSHIVNMLSKLMSQGHDVDVVLTTSQDYETLTNRMVTKEQQATFVWNVGKNLEAALNRTLPQQQLHHVGRLTVHYCTQTDIYPNLEAGGCVGFGKGMISIKQAIQSKEADPALTKSERAYNLAVSQSGKQSPSEMRDYSAHTDHAKETQIAMVLGKAIHDDVDGAPVVVLYLDDTKSNVQKQHLLTTAGIEKIKAQDNAWLQEFGTDSRTVTEELKACVSCRRARLDALEGARGIDDSKVACFMAWDCSLDGKGSVPSRFKIAVSAQDPSMEEKRFDLSEPPLAEVERIAALKVAPNVDLGSNNGLAARSSPHL
ncbi:MAG: hypothetical protein NTW08_03865 [Gammaproteobacteria bacterium]|nr:hypothetical protein [Gammaproteobacteria bacterium]